MKKNIFFIAIVANFFLFHIASSQDIDKSNQLQKEAELKVQDSILKTKFINLYKKAVASKEKNDIERDSFLYYINESINTFLKVKNKNLADADLLYYEKEVYFQEKTNYKEALKTLNDFRNLYKENKHWDKTTLIIANTTAGNYNLNLGNFETAIQKDLLPNLKLIDSLSKFAKNEQYTETYDYGKLLTYNFLILNFTNNGKFTEAYNYIDSLKIYTNNRAFSESSKSYLEDVYTTIIDTYLQQGDHDDAFFFVRMYDDLYEKPSSLTLMRILDKKRKLYYATKKYDSVIQIHQQSKKLYSTIENPNQNETFYYGKSLEQTAMVLYKQFAKEDEAIAYLNEAVKTSNPAKYTTYSNPLFCYSKLIEIYNQQNQQNKIFEYLNKLDSLSFALKNKSYIITSKAHYASFYLKQKTFDQFDINNANFLNLMQWKNVDYFLKTKLDALYLTTGNNFLIETIRMADANFKMYEETKELSYLQIAHKLYSISALTLNAQKTATILNETEASNFEKINNGILETLHQLSIHENSKYDVSESLELLELNQNLNLIFNNYLNKISFQSAKVSKPLIQLKNKTEFKFKQITKSLDEFVLSKNNTEDYNLKLSEQYILKKSLDSIYQEIKKVDALYYAYEASHVKLEDIQQQIDPKQAILRYYFSDKSLFVFVIEKNQIALQRIADRNLVEENNTQFYEAITTQQLEDFSYLNQLVPKQLENINVNKIKIIPHKNLTLIPFEALTTTTNQLLVEKYSIGYAPSLNLLSNKQNKTPLKMASFVPSYEKSDSQNKYYTNLNAAKEEVKIISELLDGNVFEGKNATKSNFIQATENYNVLHLAMHTQYADWGENQSNLMFYEDEEEEILSVQEIYTLSIAAKLAVLSACNTGTGNENPSEGIQSLARAFHYAGSDAVVMSLWKVPDSETSKIMVDFYRHLMDGKAKDEALQLAKANYLATTEDPMLKHPYYWAGFVLSGNTQPIVNSRSQVIYFTLGLVFSAFVVFILVRRKSKS